MKQLIWIAHNEECSNCPDMTSESQNEPNNIQILGEEQIPRNQHCSDLLGTKEKGTVGG